MAYMIGKYMRFYHVPDDRIMAMPIKRFFVLFNQIGRINAEETLQLLRIVSQPYMDPKKHKDNFVEDLQKLAKIPIKEKPMDLISSDDLKTWGIGRRFINPADDLSRGIHIKE